MDVICCVRSLIQLQRQLQIAIGIQEAIQNDLLAHLLRPEQTRLTTSKGHETSEDIETCFSALESAACALSIPQSKWTKQIMDLVGMNRTDGLNSSLQNNEYDVVKDHLCNQARTTEEQWEVSFTLASFDTVKGPRDLGQGLDQAARLWLKPTKRSAEDVVRLVALHRFVTLLPSAASDWVMQHRPKDMEQAIGLAEQFLGTRREETYRDGEREVTRGQCTGKSSEISDASEIRINQANSVNGEEDHVPFMTTPKEETSLELCQSVSFNMKVEGLGEIDQEEKEEEGNEPERLATVKLEPMEDDDCGAGAVTESPSIQDLSAPGQDIVFSPPGQSSPGNRPSSKVNSISPAFVMEAAAPINSHAFSGCGESLIMPLLLQSSHAPLFACQKCEAKFTSKSLLAQHSHSHMVQSCPHCDRFFLDSHSLRLHLHTHSKVHNCRHCSTVFPDSRALRMHLRTHITERPHRCPDCGDRFMRENVLLEHRNIHTGQRPYVCPECGKAFSHGSTLANHRHWHSDLRPFLCTLCGKAFKLKSALKRHQQRLHDTQ